MKAIFLCLLAAAVAGCTTVTPSIVKPVSPAVHGNTANGGLISVGPNGAIIDAELRAKYNGLIEAGYGSKKHFLPPIEKDAGVTPNADGTYTMDKEHLADLIAMNLLERSGIKP